MKFNEQRVRELIRGNAPESRVLDYKQDFYGGRDQDKHEVTKDISALANTNGGQIILGVKESGGKNEVIGVNEADIDAQTQRMQSLLTANVEPRIEHVEFHQMDMDGKKILVINVPASHRSPHRIRDGNKSFFYMRTASQTETMDIQQLCEAFTRSDDLYARARSFRDNRIAKIVAGQAPRILDGETNIVVHVLPLAEPRTYLFVNESDFPWSFLLPSKEEFYGQKSFNFDGAIYAPGPENHCDRYVQLFRDGSVESLRSCAIPKGGSLSTEYAESWVLAGFRNGINHCREFHNGDVIAMVSVTGAAGIRFTNSSYTNRSFDRDLLLLPEILVEGQVNDQYAMNDLIRPSLNILFQAAGNRGR